MRKSIIKIFIFIFCFFVSTLIVSAENKIIETETDDKIMFIADNDGKFSYSWVFDKTKYNNSDLEFDLGIEFDSPNKKEINSLISKNMQKEYVSFNYHGNLPSTATVKVPITKFEDGDKLNLYYYNDKTKEIETIKTNIKVINGHVTFEIDHCSDYFLTMSVVKEAKGKNNSGILIVGMLIVIVGLVGYTMFNNKK